MGYLRMIFGLALLRYLIFFAPTRISFVTKGFVWFIGFLALTFLSSRVLELGAGAALPSLVCCRLKASFVLITDYPSNGILENEAELLAENGIVTPTAVLGYEWGHDVSPLLCAGVKEEKHSPTKYDVILLAELLWHDTYPLHDKLLQSTLRCMNPDGVALVSFAKRPFVAAGESVRNDDDFFSRAEELGFIVSHLFSKVMQDVCDSNYVEVSVTSLTFKP